jgi:hypothetical protein
MTRGWGKNTAILRLLLGVFLIAAFGFAENSIQWSSQFEGEWWQVLGVQPSASRDKIWHAYRNLSKRYHQDMVQHRSDKEKVTANYIFHQVDWALKSGIGDPYVRRPDFPPGQTKPRKSAAQVRYETEEAKQRQKAERERAYQAAQEERVTKSKAARNAVENAKSTVELIKLLTDGSLFIDHEINDLLIKKAKSFARSANEAIEQANVALLTEKNFAGRFNLSFREIESIFTQFPEGRVKNHVTAISQLLGKQTVEEKLLFGARNSASILVLTALGTARHSLMGNSQETQQIDEAMARIKKKLSESAKDWSDRDTQKGKRIVELATASWASDPATAVNALKENSRNRFFKISKYTLLGKAANAFRVGLLGGAAAGFAHLTPDTDLGALAVISVWGITALHSLYDLQQLIYRPIGGYKFSERIPFGKSRIVEHFYGRRDKEIDNSRKYRVDKALLKILEEQNRKSCSSSLGAMGR